MKKRRVLTCANYLVREGRTQFPDVAAMKRVGVYRRKA